MIREVRKKGKAEGWTRRVDGYLMNPEHPGVPSFPEESVNTRRRRRKKMRLTISSLVNGGDPGIWKEVESGKEMG
jgi:hypothetical protein